MAAVPFCPGFWMDANGSPSPLPFVPGFWVPAPVSGYGAGPAGMTVCFVFLWVPACAGMTGGGVSEPQITQIFADGL